jgi:large subunit ribosomal protein L4
MKLTVNPDIAGGKGKAAEIEVSDEVFAARFNESLVHQCVIAYQANARSGTRAQKNRSAVRGGGRKPYAQKGTGQARAGTIRSPLWRGGGKVFPSSPDENFTHKVNRKMHRAGMRSIFSELLRQDRLVAVAGITLPAIKTKALAAQLDKLGSRSALIVTDAADEKLTLSARNLPHVSVCDVKHLDPVSLVQCERVIVTAPALAQINEMYK